MAAPKKGTSPAERQNGIDRTIDLLEALLHLRAPSRLSDLAKQMGAPRSTVYAIANRLIEADLLESVGEGGQVYFGKAVHLYGRAYAEANPLHRRCREALDRLATQHSATAQLCALQCSCARRLNVVWTVVLRCVVRRLRWILKNRICSCLVGQIRCLLNADPSEGGRHVEQTRAIV